MGGPEERGEGWFGGVDALDLVYVCGVDGGGEGAEEEGGGREGGRYGVCMEAGRRVSVFVFLESGVWGCGLRDWGNVDAYNNTSDGSPYLLYTICGKIHCKQIATHSQVMETYLKLWLAHSHTDQIYAA